MTTYTLPTADHLDALEEQLIVQALARGEVDATTGGLLRRYHLSASIRHRLNGIRSLLGFALGARLERSPSLELEALEVQVDHPGSP